MELLLQHGANVEIVDKEGRTPLHKAVQVAHTEAVRRIVRCGVDLDFKDDTGRSVSQSCPADRPSVTPFLTRKYQMIRELLHAKLWYE